MAESKSKWFALFINARSEKSREFDLNPFKSLADISECRMHVARSDDDALPSEGRGHKFESCRARQRINGLPGPSADRASPSYPVATKLSNEGFKRRSPLQTTIGSSCSICASAFKGYTCPARASVARRRASRASSTLVT